MPVKTITSRDGVLARLIPGAEWQEGSNFFSEDHEYLQVGTWNYPAGKTLGPHIHNGVYRTINYTCEALFVFSGSVQASIYDCQERLIEQVVLKKGDILILLQGGHGYEILEDHTRVLEIKNGPYGGADVDRRMILKNDQSDTSQAGAV
ncbi:MAG: hypothetical protein ACM3PE_01620 [Deltaproteobacteria bacterium]